MNKRAQTFTKWLFTSFAALLLLACGSGGDSLLDLQGVSTYKLGLTGTSGTLGPSSSILLSATLKDSTGAVVAGKTVQFSATGPGALSASSAVTNASGVATITLNGNGGSGSGAVNATFTDSSKNVVSSSFVYTVINSDNLTLTLNKNSAKSGSGDSVLLTAFLTNSTGVIQALKQVVFTVDTASGGSITVNNAGITDTNGLVTATYFPSTTDRSNKSVSVSAAPAATPTVVASATIDITGTTIKLTAAPTAATIGDTVTINGTVTDGNGAAIGSQAITLASPNFPGGQVVVSTDSTGKIPAQTATVTSAPGGVATFTGTGVGATGSASVAVSGTSFSFKTSFPAPGEEIITSTPKTITATYLVSGIPQVGQTIFFSSSLGAVSPSSAVTDGSGNASSSVSSSSAGQAVITANTAGGVIQTSRNVLFVGGTPTQISLQAGQTTLAPNTQTQLTATVRDASNNPVKGKVVEFNVITDPSSSTIGLSASTAVTDGAGQASVSYTAGPSTTATNGITIRATVQGTAVATQAAVAPLDAQLTVGGQAVFISIGTSNKLEPVDVSTFGLPHNVVITDASGAPIANQSVTLSIIPIGYFKGFYIKGSTIPVTPPAVALSGWQFVSANFDSAGVPIPDPVTGKSYYSPYYCTNEDVNSDGIIQTAPIEDLNGNGRLDPGNPVTLSSGTITTGSTGFAPFSVLYGQNYANWLYVRLRVTTKVNGTESKAELFFVLPGLASSYTDETVSPPNSNPPFGSDRDCASPN